MSVRCEVIIVHLRSPSWFDRYHICNFVCSYDTLSIYKCQDIRCLRKTNVVVLIKRRVVRLGLNKSKIEKKV